MFMKTNKKKSPEESRYPHPLSEKKTKEKTSKEKTNFRTHKPRKKNRKQNSFFLQKQIFKQNIIRKKEERLSPRETGCPVRSNLS